MFNAKMLSEMYADAMETVLKDQGGVGPSGMQGLLQKSFDKMANEINLLIGDHIIMQQRIADLQTAYLDSRAKIAELLQKTHDVL